MAPIIQAINVIEEIIENFRQANLDIKIVDIGLGYGVAYIAKVINTDSDNIKLDYKNIYNDVDIFETISNITGFKIKKLYEDKCIFLDNDKEIVIEKDNLSFNDYLLENLFGGNNGNTWKNR